MCVQLNPEAQKVSVAVRIYGTGDPISGIETMMYAGTYFKNGGSQVHHVYLDWPL